MGADAVTPRSTLASWSAAVHRAVALVMRRAIESGNAFQVIGTSPLVAGDAVSVKNSLWPAGRLAISSSKLFFMDVCQSFRNPARVARSARSSIFAGVEYLNIALNFMHRANVRRIIQAACLYIHYNPGSSEDIIKNAQRRLW